MAEAIRAKRELELQASINGLIPSQNLKASFIAYMEMLADKCHSHNTRASWLNVINKLKIFMKRNDLLFGQITKGLMENFKDFLVQDVSQNTAQKYFAMTKTALYHAVRHELIQHNPAQYITIKKQETLPKFLTLDEIRKLAMTPCENQSIRNAFLFSCFTGLRYGDIVSLKWKNVVDGYLEFSQRKTSTPERMPMASQALKILEEQKNVERSVRIEQEYQENVVFYMPRQSTVDKALKRWGKRASITKTISFHKARHTFATLSLTCGNDLYTTSKLLGHKDLRSTQIYAKVTDEKKKLAVENLPTIEIL
jgi:site-specific recombinase XerD